MVDFALYQKNLNVFLVGQISFEFLASGGVYPSHEFRVTNHLRYRGIRAVPLIIVEILVILLLIGYLVEESVEFARGPKAYITSDFWNVVDTITNWIMLATVATRISEMIVFRNSGILDAMAADDDTVFVHFQRVATLDTSVNNLLGINAAFLWFKLFKYSTFSFRTQLITAVIHFAFGDMIVRHPR